MISRGDDAAARDAIERGVQGPSNRCRATRLARSSLLGWVEARKLAPAGGAANLLGPATRSLEELEQLKEGELVLDVEYAQTAIRAAVAAAQDERPEMELLLVHAR